MAHRARSRLAADSQSFFARTRPYAKGHLTERERRDGSRPSVRPSFLPSVLQLAFIFGSFAPKSQRDVLSFFLLLRPNRTRARRRRRFPLAHAPIVIVMSLMTSAAATTAEAGALHVQNGSLVCQTCQK